jgi:hypothetical protein
MISISLVVQRVYSQSATSLKWKHTGIDPALPGNEYGTALFTLADYDLDGDLDITVSRREIEDGRVFWYENVTGIWKRHNVGISDKEQLGAVSDDVNDDGYPDLVAARFWFENPKVLDKYPDSSWIRHTYNGGLPNENHDIVACDFNNDGKKEILCYSQKAGEGTLRLYITDSADAWSFHDISTTINLTVGSVPGSNGIHGGFAPNGVGDLDNDGFADIVMPAGWYKNPGRNLKVEWQYKPWPFQIGITPNLYGISIRSWIVDFDFDGDNDIIYTDCDVEGSKGYRIINRHGGKKFERHSLPSPGDPTGSLHSLAVADFDSDGDIDIFTGEQEDPDSLMKPEDLKERGFFWMNTGSRKRPIFRVNLLHIDNPGWHDVQIGDVDGDQDLDIVSKVWNKDGKSYHVDLWENTTIPRRKSNPVISDR